MQQLERTERLMRTMAYGSAIRCLNPMEPTWRTTRRARQYLRLYALRDGLFRAAMMQGAA